MDYRGWCRAVNNLKSWNKALISAAEKQAAEEEAASKRWFAEKQAENDKKFAQWSEECKARHEKLRAENLNNFNNK